jgi:hypothetical protein
MAEQLQQQQATISWSDANYPHHLVSRYVALHYFEQSPFFEPTGAINTLARQQGRDPAVVGALECAILLAGLGWMVTPWDPAARLLV